KSVCSSHAVPTNWARFNRHEPNSRNSWATLRTITMTTMRYHWAAGIGSRGVPTIPYNRGGGLPMGGGTMGLPRILLLVMVIVILGMCQLAWAQSPTYGLGKTPSAEELRAWDIAISPTGKELPPGRGTAKEGAPVYAQKCASCHGATGYGGRAPQLIKTDDTAPAPGSKEPP